MAVNQAFWQNKRVLITGHSGFKGSWLTLWLSQLGARVTGLSLKPETKPNLFEMLQIDKKCDSHILDITNESKLKLLFDEADPEIVFHLAAKSLVRESYSDPILTFKTNVMGTANLLNAIRFNKSLKAAVFVTTDKVYKNSEVKRPYQEEDVLGGHDPYSSSKAASEIVIESFYKSFLNARRLGIASARAGNVLGGGDWSKDRLIPDAIKAWDSGQILKIRNPSAIRPWQHVLEPLYGYMILAENLSKNDSYSGSYNIGPDLSDHLTVLDIVNLSLKSYGSGFVEVSKDHKNLHEAEILQLNTNRAKKLFDLKPRWDVSIAIQRTINWYKLQKQGVNAEKLCLEDIKAFEDNDI